MPKHNKTSILTIRCTEKEERRYKKQADKLGISVSEYLRRCERVAELEVSDD